MPLPALLAPVVGWIFRTIIIKFVVVSSIFAALTLLIPKAIEYIAPHVGLTGLNNAFAGLDGGVWFFVDFFALDYGLPLMISAIVARFLIRRLPVIG